MEGHLGKDGRRYLVDLSRLFPPEFPRGPAHRNDIWFKLMRAEAVQSYGPPLSSDALSAWGGSAISARNNNAEVRSASIWLREHLVPKCALEIDANVREGSARNSAFRVRNVLHRLGVNVRYLGLVRSLCVEPLARSLLALELAARTIKCDINSSLRSLMESMRLPVDQPYRHFLVVYMNVVLGGLRSEEFWKIDLRLKVIEKFGPEAFSQDELAPGYDLRRTIEELGIAELVRRILGSLGIVLSKKAKSEIVRDPDSFRFVDPDIWSWDPKVS